jgi:hypothetical protein
LFQDEEELILCINELGYNSCVGKKFSNICITGLLKVFKQEAQRSYKHGKEIFKDKEKSTNSKEL